MQTGGIWCRLVHFGKDFDLVIDLIGQLHCDVFGRLSVKL